MKKNIAKIMTSVSGVAAFVFFVVLKSGIGEVEAPKNYMK